MIRTQSQVIERIQLKSYKEELIGKAELALVKLFSKPNGRTLLEKINNLSNEDRFVTIEITTKSGSKATPFLTASQLERFRIKEYDTATNSKVAMAISRHRVHEQGEGVGAVVLWNADDAMGIRDGGVPVLIKDEEQSFVSLGHELVHASRYLEGHHYNDGAYPMPGTGSYIEEERATGIGHFANERLSENGIRVEHGMKERKSYFEI
jgi:hypothetical protein